MEANEEISKIDVMTTFHDEETLVSLFWHCFLSACIPAMESLDGVNRTVEIKIYIIEIELG